MKDGEMHLFDKGGHPALLSNKDKFINLANDFFSK